jgi:hypothetical protein
MKLFDVVANIVAGLFVWVAVTGLVYFFVSWGNDEAPGTTLFWPWKALILFVSALTFSLYAGRYWKKLER